jgi:quercetin dioxygenase-like cupin family protein
MVMRYAAMGLVASIVALGAVPAAFAQQQNFKRTEVLRAPLDGVPGKEIIVWTTDYPPGAQTPLHTHPGQEVTYVLDGAVVLEPTNPDKAPAGLKKAGDAWSHPMGEAHVAKNASQKDPAKVLIIMIADKGDPVASDALLVFTVSFDTLACRRSTRPR